MKEALNKSKVERILKFDTLESLSKRYGIMLEAGFRDRDRVLEAAERIDRLRKKHGVGKAKITAVGIIRKWRASR